MRTTEQTENLNKLIQRLQTEYNFEEILKDTTILFKQHFLLDEFERLFVEGNVMWWYDKNTDVEDILRDYIRFFFLYRTYIVYFEYFEKYEMCSMLMKLIPLVRIQYMREIKEFCRISDDELIEQINDVEEEVINYTKELYG